MGIFGEYRDSGVHIFYQEIILDSPRSIKSLTSCHASRDDDVVDQL